MPIAGGILVAGSAARCLSSAAGMFRFLARLSGRRRHVRRSCGPGGGCCVASATGEMRTAAATTTTTTMTTTLTAASAAASATREVVAGGTTTMTSIHQDRRKDCCDEPINRIQDPSWIEENFRHDSARIADEQDARLFAVPENHKDRTQKVYPLRQERTRTCLDCEQQDLKVHSHRRECSRLGADQEFCEIRQNTQRLSMDDLDDSKLHRVEQIPENQRLTRRQRLHRTSRCRSTSTRTTDSQEEWRTRSDYVDLIVRGHHHENRQRGTTEQQRDSPNSSFCNSNTRRSRIPPYLATLLIISYTLFGIADACSSRSTPKPRPPTVTSRPNITFHMYICPPDYAEWYCLNGATCFTVKIQESLLYNCICSNGFIGQRCEFKDLDGSYLPSRKRVMLETASIAGGATIAVFLVVIICIAAYIHCKRKQKELRTSSTCVDTVDGPGRDLELRPFSNRSLMIFIAKNPNGTTMCPSIEQTRMPGWNDYSQMESPRITFVHEGKRGSSQ